LEHLCGCEAETVDVCEGGAECFAWFDVDGVAELHELFACVDLSAACVGSLFFAVAAAAVDAASEGAF
jgi:hypothetical protein